jgi:serpin B
MHQTGWFSMAHGDGATVLEMPYAKSDLAMDIVLPNDTDGLSRIEEKLGTSTFASWTSSMSKQRVAVSFPKAKFSWGGSVKNQLKSLGMTTAFVGGRADFTGIAPAADTGGPLYVDDVFHKAFVAIDEKGTEAAAATGVVGARATAVEAPPEAFRADHPFVFVIRDVKRGRILFMGRVEDPRV